MSRSKWRPLGDSVSGQTQATAQSNATLDCCLARLKGRFKYHISFAFAHPTLNNTKMSDQVAIKKYLHVKQSHAEIHVLPLKVGEEDVNFVGTHGCRTCLCVYVRLNANTVFIAHMVAHGEEPKEKEVDFAEWKAEHNVHHDQYKWEWTSDQTRGLQLKERVMAQLQATLPESTRAVKPIEAFAVCPALLADGELANGWWMRAAVQEYFHLEDIEVRRAHGFVAGPGADTELLTWKGAKMHATMEQRPKFYGWKACDMVKEQQRVFGFVYAKERGEWIECAEWDSESTEDSN
jgi:hypothetical protein